MNLTDLEVSEDLDSLIVYTDKQVTLANDGGRNLIAAKIEDGYEIREATEEDYYYIKWYSVDEDLIAETKHLFGADVKTLVMPGVAANRTDVVIDGVTYQGWLAYYLMLVEQMYEEGILVGARGDGFGEANMGKNFVITPETFKNAQNRLNIYSYTAKDINSIDSWKQYIDYALESGGWANFCLHQIFPDGTVSEAFHLKISQAKELFGYTNRDDVWVANYEEAAKYYAEWSTAEVEVKCINGVISVTLTDGENNEVYDEALTVKVTVPTSWETCLVNGSETVKVYTDDNGVSYVYVNIIPDSGVVTITNG